MNPFDRDAFKAGMEAEFARQRAAKEPKELNARIPRPAEPLGDRVCIEHNHYTMAYEIRLPRRGRLGDTAMLDQDGRPLNVGPSRENAGEFGGDPNRALVHFRKVAKGFDRLNGIGRDA